MIKGKYIYLGCNLYKFVNPHKFDLSEAVSLINVMTGEFARHRDGIIIDSSYEADELFLYDSSFKFQVIDNSVTLFCTNPGMQMHYIADCNGVLRIVQGEQFSNYLSLFPILDKEATFVKDSLPIQNENERKVVAFGSSSTEIFDYILNLLPKMFVETAPLSVLLAGLITVSIMASNLEIVSLKTSGIRFLRIVRAPLIIAFVISLIVFFINNSIYTKSLAKINFYRRGEVDESLKLPTTKENAFFINNTDGYLYLMGKINRETGVAENIEVVKFETQISKPKEIITAKSAKFDTDEDKSIFSNVNIYNVDTKETVTKTEYKSDLYKDDPSNFIRASAEDPRMLTIKELKKTIKEQKSIGEDTRIYLSELAKRYSFPFASFIVAFIGLSVSSKYVRGGRTTMNLVICVIAGYGYYLVSGAFEAMSLNGILNPFIASWIPNILYLIIGIYFMNRAEY